MSEDTDSADTPDTRETTDGLEENTAVSLEFQHPTRVSVDEQICVTVSNIPHNAVDIRISLTDSQDREWMSKAKYNTSAGTVSPTSMVSVNDNITGGLTELIQRANPKEGTGPYQPGREVNEVTVQVEHAGKTLGSTTIERTYGTSEITSKAIDNESFVGRLYEPPENGPTHPVVVLHGSSGTPADGIARLLASHGFEALAVQYFDWRGQHEKLPAGLERVPMESVENAVLWMSDRGDASTNEVGIFGMSKGGELALLLGSRVETVGPVVSVNGSGIVWAGISQREFPPGPSWVTDGEPVPYVPFVDDDSVWDVEPPMEMEPGYSKSFEVANEATIDRATISVESIAGPVLLVSGGADRMWDSQHLHNIAASRLDRHDRAYQHLVYPDAGHAITAPYQPTAERHQTAQFVMGGSAAGYARADGDHWKHVIETFESLQE